MNSNKIRPTSGNETHLAYRAEIDGLRALAVIPVILFHAGFEWFKGGFVGVDVFFVISGYLITGIIIKQKEAGTFSLVYFYVRRARRILPALFFVMLVCVPIAWMWMAPFQLKRFAWSLASVSLFSSNFLFARTTGYFDPSVEEIPLLHTWSLGVEEQYYVIFPPLVIVLWRLGIKKLAWVTVLVALLSLAYSEWGWRNHPTVNFYFTPTRAWELLLGSLLAYASFGKPLHERVAPVVSDLASAAGLLLVVGAILLYDSATPTPSVYAVVPTAGAALILGFTRVNSWTGKLLSLRWVVGIGLVSYSAYLWHYPLFAFARIRSQADLSYLTTGLIIVSTFVLAFVSWKYVETPFRKRPASRERERERAKVFGVAAAFSLMFAFLGVLGHVGNGFASRLNADQLAAYERIRESNSGGPSFGACQFQTESVDTSFVKRFEGCAVTNGPALVVVGDSHGYDLFNAVVFNSNRAFIVSISKGACRPYPPRPDCHYQAVLEFASVHKNHIDTVIFTQAGTYYLTRTAVTPVDEEVISRTQDYLARLSDSVRVVWLGPKAEPMINLMNMNVLFREFSERDGRLEKKAIYALDDRLMVRNQGQPFTYVSMVKTVRYDFKRDFFTSGKYTYSYTDHWSNWG